MVERDWVVWHRQYDDPESSLSRRLVVVRRRIGEALDALGARRRVVSLCAGDGRDLLPELAARPTAEESVLLVELQPSLVDDARRRVGELGLSHIDVRHADAGDPASFADRLPVDLLVLCGIFGNVADADVRATLAAVPSMVSTGGFVIWTRGVVDGVDLRPAARTWSANAGLVEMAFDRAESGYGVGLYGVPNGRAQKLPTRLFTFTR